MSIANRIGKYFGPGFQLEPAAPILAEVVTLLVQLRKYGLHVPEIKADTSVDDKLGYAANYMAVMGPLLRDGHIKEAKAMSESICAEISEAESRKHQ